MVRIAEIGGYLELERFRGELYHGDAIPLNSARGCLAYLAELRGIGTMWIPDFMCGCVPEYLERIGVAVRTFPVGVDLLPDYRRRVASARRLLWAASGSRCPQGAVCLRRQVDH